MSQYKYWWRPNVERDVRAYPAIKASKEAAQGVSMTANYNPAPGRGSDVGRTTESAALRQLSDQEESIYYAVNKAIEIIQTQRDGAEVLELIRLVDWQRRCNLAGAARLLYMSERTARSRRSRFLYLVARFRGYDYEK